MKTRYLLIGTAVLAAAGGLWACRAAWRAHHELVSLDVREAPLAEVLRKVERQTWTKLRAEKALDARITLRVKDEPLSYVLKRIGDQAGARWSRLYAVYSSSRALGALDSALAGDGKIEPAGWARVALKPPAMNLPGQMRMTWPLPRLLIEASLSERLGGEPEEGATAEAAARLARKVNGRWTTYMALAQMPKGLRFTGGGFGGGFRGPPPPGFDPSKLAQNNKLGPNDRFVRLTPDQRVQRAREYRELRERREREGR